MIFIKRFIDKVSLLESKQGKDFVMPIIEARGLRDELAKVLIDCYQKSISKKDADNTNIHLEVRGGTFK